MNLLLISLFSLSLFAAESFVYKIAGSFYSFTKVNDVIVSGNCSKECVALKKLKSLSKFEVKAKKDEIFAKPLGAYVCDEILKGQSLLGKDSKKNMVAFCYFNEDESMIEMNSLGAHAKKYQKEKK